MGLKFLSQSIKTLRFSTSLDKNYLIELEFSVRSLKVPLSEVGLKIKIYQVNESFSKLLSHQVLKKSDLRLMCRRRSITVSLLLVQLGPIDLLLMDINVIGDGILMIVMVALLFLMMMMV